MHLIQREGASLMKLQKDKEKEEQKVTIVT